MLARMRRSGPVKEFSCVPLDRTCTGVSVVLELVRLLNAREGFRCMADTELRVAPDEDGDGPRVLANCPRRLGSMSGESLPATLRKLS